MDESNEAVETVPVLYSRAGDLYYVERLDMHRPRDWVAVTPDPDGKFRVYPFAFYDVKSGESTTLPIDHVLVQRYIKASKWPARGTPAWIEETTRVRDNMRESLAHEERSVAFYRREIEMAESLLQKYGPKEA